MGEAADPGVGRVIRSHDCVAEGAAWLAAADPRFAYALEQTGRLPLRLRKDGYAALLDAIVSQQVSVAAADAIWGRLKAAGLTGPRKVRPMNAVTDVATPVIVRTPLGISST